MSHIVSEKPYMRFSLRKRSLGYRHVTQARSTMLCTTSVLGLISIVRGEFNTYYSMKGGIMAFGRLLYPYRLKTENRTQIA